MWNSRLQCCSLQREIYLETRILSRTRKDEERPLHARLREISFVRKRGRRFTAIILFHLSRQIFVTVALTFHEGMWSNLTGFILPLPRFTRVSNITWSEKRLTSASDFLPLRLFSPPLRDPFPRFSSLSFVRTSRWRSSRALAWRRKSFGPGNARTGNVEILRMYARYRRGREYMFKLSLSLS